MNKWMKLVTLMMAAVLLVACSAPTADVSVPDTEPVSKENSEEESSVAQVETAEASEEAVVEESSSETLVEESEELPAEEESVVEEIPQLPIVGNVTGTDTELSVTLINQTQGTISGMEIITPDGQEWTGQMITDGVTFAPGDSFILVFDPAAAAGDDYYNVILYFLMEQSTDFMNSRLAIRLKQPFWLQMLSISNISLLKKVK